MAIPAYRLLSSSTWPWARCQRAACRVAGCRARWSSGCCCRGCSATPAGPARGSSASSSPPSSACSCSRPHLQARAHKSAALSKILDSKAFKQLHFCAIIKIVNWIFNSKILSKNIQSYICLLRPPFFLAFIFAARKPSLEVKRFYYLSTLIAFCLHRNEHAQKCDISAQVFHFLKALFKKRLSRGGWKK